MLDYNEIIECGAWIQKPLMWDRVWGRGDPAVLSGREWSQETPMRAPCQEKNREIRVEKGRVEKFVPGK